MKQEEQKLYKPATKCRVYTWPYEQLYFGPIPERGIVHYSSPVLRVGLGGNFYLRFNKGEWLKYNCIFIPAGVAHEVFPTDVVIAKYWVEKESNDYPFFHQNLFKFHENSLISCFQHIYEAELNSNEARVKLNRLFYFKPHEKQILDSRMLEVSRIIRREPDYNFSIEYLASIVDLSPSRLLHLIKEETGTSYRKFRMWQRLRYAISVMGSTHSLTYAAVEAGFNDSSHFSRCFKMRYGVVPSVVHKTLEMYKVS